MITPRFAISQDKESVTIIIKTSCVRSQDLEFDVDGNIFHFSLPPYYLRLELPGNVVEDERSKASYDAASGEITVTLPKENPGEDFKDLDMVTKLLTRSDLTMKQAKTPLIEVMKSTDDVTSTSSFIIPDFNVSDENTYEQEEILPNCIGKYGFNGLYSGYFTHLRQTGSDFCLVDDPEMSSPISRRAERIQKEDLKFDEEYYMSDFVNAEEIKQYISFKTPWFKLLKDIEKAKVAQKVVIENEEEVLKPTTSSDTPELIKSMEKMTLHVKDENQNDPIKFTTEEQNSLLTIPRREHLVENPKSIYLGLIAILFAYCYDYRTTMNDPTVESGWTISVLAPNLAALDDNFSTLREVISACMRRSLAYPLYRNWTLSLKCVDDIYILFRLGRKGILKALLGIKHILDHHENCYIYSKIIVDDYCLWIQSANDHVLNVLARDLHKIDLKKEDIGWPLEDFERNINEDEGTSEEQTGTSEEEE